ncbi:hypothetical protein [Paractinoplanes atraurantiacus]|nr:hypothetical protein [Actinoplanes atraurantiacus]
MSEDDRTVRILRTIPDEPPAPSRIDIPRTMDEGRRRRRARRWSGGVALAAVTAVAAGGGTVAVAALRPSSEPAPVVSPSPSTVAAAPAPAVPRDCTVKLLPTGDIKKATVSSGDPSGHYLTGRVYPPKLEVYTVIWKDGVLQNRPSMPGDDGAWGDINSSGVAVGYSFTKGEEQRAYVSTGSTVTPLRGGRATANAINDAGTIAGTLGDPYEGTPATWAAPGANPVRLRLPSGFRTGEAKAIDEDGTVIGTVAKRNTESTGYLWLPNGKARLMPLPEVEGVKATYFWPESVSSGWVYGRAVRDSPDGGSRTFATYRYNIAANEYEELDIPLGPLTLGAANGWVLATTGHFEPIIIAGEKAVPLPFYNKMKEYVTSAFSADGKVAAGYTTDTTASDPVANRPLMWTCR